MKTLKMNMIPNVKDSKLIHPLIHKNLKNLLVISFTLSFTYYK